MQVEEVIGFTLNEAENLLNKAFITITSIKVTSPPKCKPESIEGYYRVVNVKAVDDKSVEIFVCKPLLI